MGIICQILFHNNTQGVFYAGQMVAGQVTLSTDKAIQIKGKYSVVIAILHIILATFYILSNST